MAQDTAGFFRMNSEQKNCSSAARLKHCKPLEFNRDYLRGLVERFLIKEDFSMLVSKTRIRSALACLGLLSGFAVEAAPVLQIENGLLTGATGVTVDGKDYDVAFQKGTCNAFFSGCNERADFVFDTAEKASKAGLALLQTVFVDSALGAFDSNPMLTRGCTSATRCSLYLPFAFGRTVDGYADVVTIRNSATENEDVALPGGGNIPYSPNLYTVWSNARPVSSTAIPEPGTLALLAVAGLAAVGTRKRKAG